MGRTRRARWPEILGTQVIRLPRAPDGLTRRTLFLVAGIVFVVLSALFASWVHVQTIAFRYRYSQAYRTMQKRLQQRDALEIERQMLLSPGRVSRIAEEDLGMVLPDARDWKIVE